MATTAAPTTSLADAAVAWCAAQGISVVAWRADQLTEPVVPEGPVLHLLDPGVPAPASWDELEDWVRLPAPSEEIFARGDRLLARQAAARPADVTVDDDDLLHVDDERISLSRLEGRLLRLLLARRGDLVPRDEVIEIVWPDGAPQDPRAMENRLRALRSRIRDTPIRIHTVRGRGLLLEAA